MQKRFALDLIVFVVTVLARFGLTTAGFLTLMPIGLESAQNNRIQNKYLYN